MNLLHEWPLVLFTLTVQLAVGLHLALLVAEALPGPEDPRELPSFRGRPFLLVGVLMAGGLAVSLLHLGAPVNALRTLSNLDESWLSREILAGLVFLGLWGLDFGRRRRGGGVATRRRSDEAPAASRLPTWATAAAGIVLVLIMARIYMVPARPLWDHWLTAAGFLLTTLLLGAAVAGAHLARRPRPENPARTALSPTGATLLAVALASALAQAGVILLHPVTGALMASPTGRSLTATRLLLLLGGAMLLVIPLARPAFSGIRPSRTGKSGLWVVAALLLLGGSEVLGRMLFYAAGIPNPF
jgi:anaerobic dimethyl sulfoxide reductase subunit C (anchor subunit)